MSKLKTPRQKKLASLALDRRNVYGENDKASRKSIPRGKQRSHQGLRRAVKQPLLNLSGVLAVDDAVEIELAVIDSERRLKRKAFKKKPDAPLGAYMKAKTEPYVAPWNGGDPLGVHREILDPRKRKLDRS
jgi:hypothetical protein